MKNLNYALPEPDLVVCICMFWILHVGNIVIMVANLLNDPLRNFVRGHFDDY